MEDTVQLEFSLNTLMPSTVESNSEHFYGKPLEHGNSNGILLSRV
jgi:hypothetical protein